MIKRIILFLLLFLILCCSCGCHHDNESKNEPSVAISPVEKTESNPIEQTEFDYIVCTDWMKFYFSKKEFKESDIADIVTEAESVMADIRSYLKVNYTLEEAKETVCYFDSAYRNGDGQKRSSCYSNERRIQCVSLDDFVHEYVHMISQNNADLVYFPNKLFIEGLAEYISWNFHDEIASKEYTFFEEPSFSGNPSEVITDLLSKKALVYNAENANKALIAAIQKYSDISEIDKNSDFYNYNIGPVFIDYCIQKLGGLEKFMSVYNDSITIIDVYGKSVDELVFEACAYNTSMFFDE